MGGLWQLIQGLNVSLYGLHSTLLQNPTPPYRLQQDIITMHIWMECKIYTLPKNLYMNSNVCKANSDSLTRLGSKIRPRRKKTNASYSPRNGQTISSTTQDGWCITFFFFGSPEKISDLTDGAIRCFTNDAAISSPCCETNISEREAQWERGGEWEDTLWWHTYQMTPECFDTGSYKLKSTTLETKLGS